MMRGHGRPFSHTIVVRFITLLDTEVCMLVLGRKKNEEIVIGDGIRVVVVAIRGDSVRLGVDAPKDVPVHRKEVMDKIQKEEGAEGCSMNS